jgi:membrane protein implicated in regulation of membrane protease activity
VAFHVEFSKIKHTRHAGKEIGHMQVFEKAAAIFGPLVGGVAGAAFGSPYIFAIASVVLALSLWPLFRSAEPVRTHQKLRFRALPLSKVKHDLFAYSALGIENTLCVNIWPLYISLFALGGNVYAKLGMLTSLAVLVSIAAARIIGRLVDQRNARLILRISAVLNAAVYVYRPFVGGLVPAFATNIVNEAVTTGYRLPFLKGIYAAADDLPGLRIVYISSMECIASIVKGTLWFVLSLVALYMSVRSVLVLGFAVAGLASLFIMSERFKALKTQDGAV